MGASAYELLDQLAMSTVELVEVMKGIIGGSVAATHFLATVGDHVDGDIEEGPTLYLQRTGRRQGALSRRGRGVSFRNMDKVIGSGALS